MQFMKEIKLNLYVWKKSDVSLFVIVKKKLSVNVTDYSCI